MLEGSPWLRSQTRDHGYGVVYMADQDPSGGPCGLRPLREGPRERGGGQGLTGCVCVSAPDVIPSGLQGWGTKKNNMEISWEVRRAEGNMRSAGGETDVCQVYQNKMTSAGGETG